MSTIFFCSILNVMLETTLTIRLYLQTHVVGFFLDKRALGIWCNGIVPYKPNEFLMHRAHTITVRTRLTRQHHKHFSYVMLYFYTIGCNLFWRCILNFVFLGIVKTLMMRITFTVVCLSAESYTSYWGFLCNIQLPVILIVSTGKYIH